jgi:ribosomal protein S18 acetylase RimI-like enzyme
LLSEPGVPAHPVGPSAAPLQEPVPKERNVHADHDGYLRQHVKHEGCAPSHQSLPLRAPRAGRSGTQPGLAERPGGGTGQAGRASRVAIGWADLAARRLRLRGLLRDPASRYEAFARLFIELDAPEPGVPSALVYEKLVPRAFFAVDSEAPSAFLCWRPEGGDLLHVSMVAVLPERRRQGLGRQLMLEAARRGRAHAFARWQLNVAVDNAAAHALYAQLGMAAVFENILLELDAAVAMRHPAMRAVPTRVRFVGRFGEPAPPMESSESPVRVVVHGDAVLANELCAAGGVLIHRTLRMSGDMPESP